MITCLRLNFVIIELSVACVWGQWRSWTNCSTKCEPELQNRTRTILTEEIQGGGQCLLEKCTPPYNHSENCNIQSRKCGSESQCQGS